jgi:endoglucanase
VHPASFGIGLAVAAAVAVGGVAAAVAVAGEPAPDGRTDGPTAASPSPSTPPGALAGEELAVDPASHVPVLLAQARAEGRAEDVAVLEQLERPTATWFAGQHEDPGAEARRIVEAAAATGTTPVIVVYEVPGRDCGLYSDGGATDADAYLQRVEQIAAGLGDRPAVVVLEPDAVPQAVLGCEGLEDPGARYALLGRAVDALETAEGARVYLDAGNAAWVQDLEGLAAALTAGGVERAEGFALNVSNFRTTQESAAYGSRLSDLLDGARFVIDTSRNGSGPVADDGSGLTWCNPPGRTTGQEPTTDPGLDGVDALLWIKQPGDSDGDCRPGEPPAGEFWMAQAAELVR